MPERSFGRTVRYRRTKLGLSQAKLGELVGRSSTTVRSWERDKSKPTESEVLSALSAILGVDELTLFEKAGQQPPEVETSPTVEEALATLSPESSEDDQPLDPEPVATEPVPGDEETSGEPAPAYAAPPEPYRLTTAIPPLLEPSYMEDRIQRQLYRVRNLATIVLLIALGIAFLWALTEGIDALSVWWDDFFGNLRL